MSNNQNNPQRLVGVNDKPKCPICGEAYPLVQDLTVRPENYIVGQLLPTKSDNTKHICKSSK